MAAISNATLVADVAENINAEWIAQEMRFAAQNPHIYEDLVYKVDLMGRNTATYSEPIADELTAATSLTATDEVVAQKTARADLTVGIAPWGTAVFLDYETVRRSMWDEFALAIDRLTGACKRKIDNATLALASSISNTIGNASTVHSMSNFETVMTAWRAQVGASRSRPIMVQHGDATRDLGQEVVTSSAALMGSAVGVQLKDAVGHVGQGVRRSIGNVDLIDTDNVVAGDTTGWANFMVLNNPMEHAFALPYEQPILIEIDHAPRRRGWWVVASVVFGVGITQQDYALGYTTRT